VRRPFFRRGSQNSNAQNSRVHTRCRFLLFILLTINDRSHGRIFAACSVSEAMKPNVDAAISRSLSHGLHATDNRIRRRSLQRLSPISIL
jgi:hypothetical protein